MILNFTALAIGFLVLVLAADKFVVGAVNIAKGFGVSSLLIGLTVVGLGTSTPEILVAAIASWQGNSGLAVGNAIGSNITNIGLILGCTALVSPLLFRSTLLKRELPVIMAISLLCYFLSFGGLGVVDGLLMLAMLALFLIWTIRLAKKDVLAKGLLDKQLFNETAQPVSTRKAILFFVIGLFGLLASSQVIVWAAVNIAQFFEVSGLVIGLTIVAFGTSLPELAASITTVLKKEDDLAIGNIIGSNVYNLLAVYSLPGLIAPGAIAKSVIVRDFPVMLAFTGVLFVLGYGISKPGQISRLEGLGLFLAFCCYQFFVYQAAVA